MRVYLSLGSNVGEREALLDAAVTRLEAAAVRVLRQSSVYETEPRDVAGQPWFLNLVAEAETDLAPEELLRRIAEIEAQLGRRRLVAKGPRTIDIDILLYGGNVVRTPDLEIPHPRMAERRFVLEPLAELAPDLRHPVSGETVREMLKRVRDQKVLIRGRE